MTVDEWVAKNVPAQHRDLVAELRSLLKKNMPGAEEVISYNMPVYRYDKPVAWINAGKSGISVGFRDGTSINDKHRLLKGTGKGARNVHMKNVDEINRSALRDYIKQAVRLDRAR
ncbi:MAG TPA: DUF1801 domain-containing protein [Candidatus Dormibacteraeota bacterium]|nr:DUF1801 domain-containing protein [Candidatus Dormibacteraeota bacterium]